MLIDRLQGRRVLVIGDVMLDHVVSGTTDRVSPEAAVPILHAKSEQWTPGGAANVAVNIASLGGEAAVVGVIGPDAAGKQLDELIGQAGLRAALITDPEAHTTRKTRYLAAGRHLLRVDRETIGTSADTGRKLVAAAEAQIDGCACIVISDYAKGVVTAELMSRILAAAKDRGIPLLVDPKHPDFGLYRGAALLTPNRAELARATSEPCDSAASILRAARAASRTTGAAILLTLAEQGMALYQDGAEVWREASRAQAVRNVSGAGDTVIAACALALAAGADLGQAARLANAAAGVAVGKGGPSPPTPEELAEALVSPPNQPRPGQLVEREEAAAIRERWRLEGLTVGVANGCFDLLHPGHVQLLQAAKASCDRLVVALNTDASVRRLKGEGRPLQSQDARAAIIGAMRDVDLVVMFDEDTPLELIQVLRPDVLIKGADHAADTVVGADVVASYGGRLVLAPFAPGHSTTDLVRRGGTAETDAGR